MDTEHNSIVEIFDRKVLLEEFEDDMECLKELVDLFIQKSPEMLSNVKKAVENQDRNMLCNAAHSFRGAISNFRAQPAEKAAEVLELMGEEGNLAQSENALKNLELELKKLHDALNVFKNS